MPNYSNATLTTASAEADDVAILQRALKVPVVVGGLAAALYRIVAHEPRLVISLRGDVLPTIHRQSIGEVLRDLMPESE
jgi:hypothetical protein